MTRYGGKIGINRGPVEVSPGIYEQKIDEVYVQGEIRSEKFSWSQQSKQDGVRPRHVLSIVTPEDTVIDFTEVVYIWWMYRKWSVTSIEYKRPRVELGLGGIYND